MATEHCNVALNDQSMEVVAGGFDLLVSLSNIGGTAVDGFQQGWDAGWALGGVGSLTAGAMGGVIGALHGARNEVGNGVHEAITGLRDSMR